MCIKCYDGNYTDSDRILFRVSCRNSVSIIRADYWRFYNVLSNGGILWYFTTYVKFT